MGKSNAHMIFLLIIIVIASSLVMVYPSSSREGMESMDNAAPLGWNMGQGMGGKSWEEQADRYAANMGHKDTTSTYGQYKGTPVPLQDGQMFFFQDNQFKPECCPSNYSTGSGCACISSQQMNYLNERGGNRTIAPSEF